MNLGSILGNVTGFTPAANGLSDFISNVTGIGKTAATNNYSNIFGGPGTPSPSSPSSYRPPAAAQPAHTPPAYTPDPSTQATIDALNRQTSVLQQQMAAQPKLIYRDTNAAWQNAQNEAAGSVNPVYQDYLNNFVQKQQNALSQQQATSEAAAKTADVTLNNTQQDTAKSETRTAQDEAAALQQSQTQEGNWATGEGEKAATAEDAARTTLGDAGIEGRGAGQLQESQIQRNQASDQQVQQYENDRATKQMVASRTLSDLATTGQRANDLNATQKSDLNRALNDFVTNQGTDLTGFKSSNESARLSALDAATQGKYKTDTASWLSSLVGGGARPQDVALATQVYG